MLHKTAENSQTNQLTPEEVRSTVALWVAEQKADPGIKIGKTITVADVAEGLNIHDTEAERLVSAVRQARLETTVRLRKHRRKLTLAGISAGMVLLSGLWINSLLPAGQHRVSHLLYPQEWGFKVRADIVETPYRFVLPDDYRFQDPTKYAVWAKYDSWETHMTGRDYQDHVANPKAPSYYTVFAAGQRVYLGIFELDAYPEPHLSQDIIKLLNVPQKAK